MGLVHPPLAWALSVEGVAESNPAWETVKEVLAEVGDVLDKDKPTTVDEADPYILARALELQREGRRVRVITEETRNRPNKLALATAAGLLGLAAVTLLPFLKGQILRRARRPRLTPCTCACHGLCRALVW